MKNKSWKKEQVPNNPWKHSCSDSVLSKAKTREAGTSTGAGGEREKGKNMINRHLSFLKVCYLVIF